MSRLKRLEQIAQEFRKHLELVAVEEKLLDAKEMIELCISVKPAPLMVSCVVNDRAQELVNNNDILEKSLGNIGFPTKLINPLEDYGKIKTVGDLIKRSAKELSTVRNLGQVKLAEIRQKLADHNLKLKGD